MSERIVGLLYEDDDVFISREPTGVLFIQAKRKNKPNDVAGATVEVWPYEENLQISCSASDVMEVSKGMGERSCVLVKRR